MLMWEVVARYVFVAPTIWAGELSRVALLWGTFLGMAVLLRRREHIRITLLIGLLGARGRWLAELLTLLFIAGFSVSTAWYGWLIAEDSLVTGRTSGSMLDIPQWWSEAVIPAGFVILALQALAGIARLLGGAVPPPPERGEGSEA
jgi:TRAP-type C4-dicarboxylate transport system permease small subunit